MKVGKKCAIKIDQIEKIVSLTDLLTGGQTDKKTFLNLYFSYFKTTKKFLFLLSSGSVIFMKKKIDPDSKPWTLTGSISLYSFVWGVEKWSRYNHADISLEKGHHTHTRTGSCQSPNYTVCPGSSDPYYIVTYYINWVTILWTHSKYFRCREPCLLLVESEISKYFSLTALNKNQNYKQFVNI